MRYLLILMLLCMPLVGAYSYDEVITQGEQRDLSTGTLYILHPDAVYSGDPFLVQMVYEYIPGELRTVEFSLSNNYDYLPNTSLGESWIMGTFERVIHQNVTWDYAIEIEGEPAVLGNMSIVASKKPVVSTFTQTSQTPLGEQKDVRAILAGNSILYSALEYEQLKEYGASLVVKKTTHRNVTEYIDNTTIERTLVEITIDPTDAQYVEIIEIIPKEVAQTSDDVVSVPKATVLQRDPMIMWHLENVNESTTITYLVEKDAEVTGNTIVLAKSNEEPSNSFNWLPLLVIPLVAIIIIFFANYLPKRK